MFRLVNQIVGIEDKTYLELGVWKNKNFARVLCRDKYSVDVNGNGLFTGTTDDYFSSKGTWRWDIIYIDANHDFDFVLKDFNNSVLCCNEWIAIHDMIPPSKKYCARHLCSDSFRLLYYLLKETQFQIYPMQDNYGLTFVRMPAHTVDPPDRYRRVTYEQFTQFVDGLHLYSSSEIAEVLNV